MSTTRRPGTSGKGLESLVMAPQGLITFTRVPNAVRYLPGGKVVPCRGPCDFTGTVRGTGRHVVVDAKECALVRRFPAGNADHLPEHQRVELVAHGGSGAVAGLVVLAAAHGRVYWCDWRLLARLPRLAAASFAWEELLLLGPASRGIDWRLVLAFDTGGPP